VDVDASQRLPVPLHVAKLFPSLSDRTNEADSNCTHSHSVRNAGCRIGRSLEDHRCGV
jgi:hypothetical protein